MPVRGSLLNPDSLRTSDLTGQRARQSADVHQRNVPLPALNAGYIRPVEARPLGKPFLRQASLLAASSHRVAEALAWIHAAKLGVADSESTDYKSQCSNDGAFAAPREAGPIS